MKLPDDVARCTGADWPECADCLRRTVPPSDPDRAVWMSPPAIVVFECDSYIDP